MRISELVDRLQEIRAAEGDIRVHVYPYGDIVDVPVSAPEVVDPGLWGQPPTRRPRYVRLE